MKSRISAAALAGLFLCSGGTEASASTDFGSSFVLNGQNPVSGPAMEIATDSAGTWVLIWRSDDPGLGIDTVGGAPVVSRSTDDGQTWSTPFPLADSQVDMSERAALTTDGNGVWMVGWGDADSGTVTRTSTDNAATWGAPVVAGSMDGAQIATDGAGNWVLVGSRRPVFEYSEIVVSRSTNDGSSWSVPERIHDNPQTGHYEAGVRLATDRNGTWVACWEDVVDVLVSKSVDAGLTWQQPIVAGSSVPSIDEGSCDIATDGDGDWVVVWRYFDYTYDSLHFAHSSDNAATWSVGAPLHAFMESSTSTFARMPRIAALGSDQWQVTWAAGDWLRGTIGMDGDLLTSYSRDGGVSWSSPSALVSDAQFDSSPDWYPAMANSTTGRRIVAWTDWTGFPTHGSILSATSDSECPPAPRNDCHESIEPGGSKLALKDATGGADRLKWRFSRGELTTDAELGDPMSTDSFVLCLYEEALGSSSLIAEWDVKAGTVCEGEPCWSVREGSVKYRDTNHEEGAVASLKVLSGESGRPSIRLKASGPALGLPKLPIDLAAPLRVQLANLGTSACWSATHSTASANTELKLTSASD